MGLWSMSDPALQLVRRLAHPTVVKGVVVAAAAIWMSLAVRVATARPRPGTEVADAWSAVKADGLGATMVGPRDRWAVIDGRPVRAGDAVDWNGARWVVEGVTPGRVGLVHDGERVELAVPGWTRRSSRTDASNRDVAR